MKNSIKESTWYFWLFPVMAVGISGWLLFSYFQNRGETIRIYFEDASNIQAGKTFVRYRGVTIGEVKEVKISEDSKEAVATIELEKDAAQFATEGTRFWVVVPKVSFAGVSGLETLFQGPYIAAQPGKTDADIKQDFKGQQGNESNDVQEFTTSFSLETTNVESVSANDVITYRGMVVGNVDRLTLSKSAQTALVHVKILNRYLRLVRTNTAFWKKVGIQAKLGLFGSEIKVNSLESIMRGGVELSTPDNPGELAKAHTVFRLLPGPPKGSEKWNPNLDMSKNIASGI